MDKFHQVRELILGKIESGEWPKETKLPSARNFSISAHISLSVVQLAFASLVRDGVLRSVPRQGTYVRADWSQRLLPGSIRCFRPIWSELIRGFEDRHIDGLRICDQFETGFFEIRTTPDAQSRQRDYLDLAAIFTELYPDTRDFFMAQFQPYYTLDGKLYGIPLSFSPTVIGCNLDMFDLAGIPYPTSDWSWPEFLTTVEALIARFGRHGVGVFRRRAFFFNILFRAGAGLVARAQSGQYYSIFDTPESLNGIRRLAELAVLLHQNNLSAPISDDENIFAAGNTGMAFVARQDIHLDASFRWMAVPLPHLVRGSDCCRQAADLLCVRNLTCDFPMICEVIQLLLGPELQEQIGKLGYGIPIRRSAAARSFHENDPRDQVFFSEMTRIVPEYSYRWPECYDFVSEGLYRCWDGLVSPDGLIAELEPLIQVFLKYRQSF